MGRPAHSFDNDYRQGLPTPPETLGQLQLGVGQDRSSPIAQKERHGDYRGHRKGGRQGQDAEHQESHQKRDHRGGGEDERHRLRLEAGPHGRSPQPIHGIGTEEAAQLGRKQHTRTLGQVGAGTPHVEGSDAEPMVDPGPSHALEPYIDAGQEEDQR